MSAPTPEGQPPAPPDGSISPELAFAQLSAGRARKRRLEQMRASGVRGAAWGAALALVGAIASFLAPPGLWTLAIALGALGTVLLAVSILRVVLSFRD